MENGAIWKQDVWAVSGGLWAAELLKIHADKSPKFKYISYILQVIGQLSVGSR